MQLDKEHIDQLYTFTRQHYVEWYDLQSELVDHLANAIEVEWQQNPKLTFEEALDIEFKKFGIFGFMDVVEERQKFLQKKYARLIWNYYKQFFRLPRIILTFASIYMLFQISELFQNPKYFFLGILVIGIAFVIENLAKTTRFYKKREKETGKKWLFEEVAKNFNSFPVLFLPVNIFNAVNSFSQDDRWTATYSLVSASLFVLVGIWMFVQLKIIPKKVSKELEKTYSEYQISK